ncbi:MAG TPA: type VI secretion system tip protein VgrG, partial [Pirellulales bacterium]|nr:type VI secretion system tip protein VgrG [Pirellulales bacterium]
MSTAFTQDNRPLVLETPLGKDTLLLESFQGHEAISQLFSYRLTVRSPEATINGKDIVGKNVTFSVQDTTGEPRYFNGFVSRLSSGARDARLRTYNLEVVPWLWFLTRTSDCRIFQNKSVPQIVEQIFTDLQFTDFTKSDIKGNHPQREYCVQYNETDFAFVSRLMEEEGIFYYFRHENGKHTLVLADQKSAHRDGKHNELEYNVTGLTPQNELQLASWQRRVELRPGVYTHTDYNFETPTVDLMSKTNTVVSTNGDEPYEVYEYPGTFRQRDDGQSLSKMRMEAHEAAYDVIESSSYSRWLNPGEKFKVKQHIIASDKGKGYVITGVSHSAHVGADYETGESTSSAVYHNAFTCIPDTYTFRPHRTTPKPRVHGVQTAVVTGPPGEEIWPDKYGRVRVQFFWDREGQKDEKSTCWVRVAHYWAGKQWGSMNIPRVGHEVLVDFIDGDVDRPVIVGSLYNAGNMPAYELPKFKTMSYVKSDTSPGSKGFNELRFEDKQGKEQVFLHSQGRMDVRTKGSLFETIGGSRNESIGVPSDKNKDGGSLNITVGGEYNLHVMKDTFIGLDKK